MKKNVLTLGTCAGIFHWSNSSFYFGTKEQNDRHRAYYNALRVLHGGKEAKERARAFEYTLNESGRPVVNYNGMEVVCNDKMIESINGDFSRCDIINGRTFADVDKIDVKKWRIMGKGWAQSLAFKSLVIDSFADGLLYHRISFNHTNVEFITSCGKLYAVGDTYKEISFEYICVRLGAESAKAKKEIRYIINFLLTV